MLKVLILDDDEDNCLTLEHIVKFAGYQACSAFDSDTFLSLIDEQHPDVVIVDLLLGDTDGISVLAQLDKLPNKPAVIIISGANQRLLEAASRSASGHGFRVLGSLAKPFNPDALRQLLQKQPQPAEFNKVIAKPKYAAISADQLIEALQLGAFYVVYQPKVECRTSSLAGFEALCRLNLPGIGEVSPEHFIALCEQYGLINQLTEFVIDSALCWFGSFLQRQRQASHLTNVRQLRLAINISALNFEQPAVFDYLTRQCHYYQIAPSAVILELTETAAMADPVKSLDILTQLRLKGFHLSIDDFGTGFSSILQLVRLPFSELKIDKHFVISAADSKESRLVISSVIDMAHALGLTVTAEGIEDRQTLAFLQKRHCDTAQGFYISRPLRAEQINDWLLQHGDDKELARLKALRALDILDSAPEERFDRIIRLAQRVLKVPTCTFSLMDQHRIWFKSKTGMPLHEIERQGSLCELSLKHNGCYYIANTLLDPATCDHPMVTASPYVRFYASHVVTAPNGVAIGSLCFIDVKPRQHQQTEQAALKDFAAMLEDELNSNNRSLSDPLTKLKNRSGFDKRAISLVKLSQNQQLSLQLIKIRQCFDSTLNIDLFNVLHDRAIKAVAQQIKKAFSGADLIARIDEDSFFVLFLAQDHSLAQLALDAFHTLFTEQQSALAEGLVPQLEVKYLQYPTGEIASLQQLYLQLDVAKPQSPLALLPATF